WSTGDLTAGVGEHRRPAEVLTAPGRGQDLHRSQKAGGIYIAACTARTSQHRDPAAVVDGHLDPAELLASGLGVEKEPVSRPTVTYVSELGWLTLGADHCPTGAP